VASAGCDEGATVGDRDDEGDDTDWDLFPVRFFLAGGGFTLGLSSPGCCNGGDIWAS
jgi:hypothetical protein